MNEQEIVVIKVNPDVKGWLFMVQPRPGGKFFEIIDVDLWNQNSYVHGAPGRIAEGFVCNDGHVLVRWFDKSVCGSQAPFYDSFDPINNLLTKANEADGKLRRGPAGHDSPKYQVRWGERERIRSKRW